MSVGDAWDTSHISFENTQNEIHSMSPHWSYFRYVGHLMSEMSLRGIRSGRGKQIWNVSEGASIGWKQKHNQIAFIGREKGFSLAFFCSVVMTKMEKFGGKLLIGKHFSAIRKHSFQVFRKIFQQKVWVLIEVSAEKPFLRLIIRWKAIGAGIWTIFKV